VTDGWLQLRSVVHTRVRLEGAYNGSQFREDDRKIKDDNTRGRVAAHNAMLMCVRVFHDA
jgi:hypothetical protein